MLSIYCQEINSRISYSFELIFGELLGTRYKLTDDLDEFLNYNGFKMAYSELHVDGFWQRCSSLLFESEIRTVDAEFDFDTNHLVLDKEGFFDPMAASFYLVSRYEEYLPYEADDHDRFPATESVLYKYQMLKHPIVNTWALELKQQLRDMYPDLLFNPRKFEFISTIDIDQAFKYEHKGWYRNAGGLARDVLKGDFGLAKERMKVLSGKIEDPFNNFNWQKDIHSEKNTNVIYFIQVGDRGEFDKNLPADTPEFKAIIKSLGESHEVGMHPSYASNTKPELVGKEKQMLEEALSKIVTLSRQHFLKHKMPDTYHVLLKNGVTADHTLGYSTHLGFRAGIAAPFLFFDLTKNKVTDLRLYPFCMMDITPLHYYQQSTEEAKIELTGMIDRIKRVGGLCISLWHNESLSENGRWVGWRSVYEHVLNQAVKS